MIITRWKQSDRAAIARFKKMSKSQKLIWILTARLGVNMMSTVNLRTRTTRDWWMPRIGGINFTGKHRTPGSAHRAALRCRRRWQRQLKTS